MSLKIKPCHLRAAREYVGQYHRHSIPPVGGKFAVACYDGEALCGVAICGRPVSRHLDDGQTLEILRCCTDGTRNVCSKLYGACCRIGFDMGYERIITYTLATETGASLRALALPLTVKPEERSGQASAAGPTMWHRRR